MTAQSPNLKELDQRLSENEIPGIWRIPPGTRPGDAAKRLAGLVRIPPSYRLPRISARRRLNLYGCHQFTCSPPVTDGNKLEELSK